MLNELKIPRHAVIHTFSDASLRACRICVYLRSVAADGSTILQLIMTEGKVATLKGTTVP